jgi:hypothetical protein
MSRKMLAGILAAGAIWASTTIGQDLNRRNSRLEEEIRLAKKPSVYLAVDAEAKVISLKMRGMILKSWDAVAIRSWGRPVGLRTVKVLRRSGWSAQDRVNMTPGKKKEEKADSKTPKDIGDDVLEIEDMPAKFLFQMENGARLAIRPRPRGILGRSAYAVGGVGRSLGRSARLIWSAIRGREFSEMRIILKGPKDAQSIFWAVPEGTMILFY